MAWAARAAVKAVRVATAVLEVLRAAGDLEAAGWAKEAAARLTTC